MPSNTSDQQITLPVDPDTADNPVAFTNFVADVEPRLVREYADAADRTARRVAVSENEISTLAAENRVEVYNGTTDISLFTRSLYAHVRKNADQSVNNTTTLTNDNTLFVALPATGTFSFELVVLYISSAAADFKVGFTWPAGAAGTWFPLGAATGSTGIGDASFNVGNTSGGSMNFGGGGAGNDLGMLIHGELTMGGTAGNLQFQFAQANLEVSNTTVLDRSSMRVWRTA